MDGQPVIGEIDGKSVADESKYSESDIPRPEITGTDDDVPSWRSGSSSFLWSRLVDMKTVLVIWQLLPFIR